jgi:hypothetical protein
VVPLPSRFVFAVEICETSTVGATLYCAEVAIR